MSKFESACADGTPSAKHKHGFEFPSLTTAKKAVVAMGLSVPIHPFDDNRHTTLICNRFGRLVVRVARHKGEDSLRSPAWVTADSFYESVLGLITDKAESKEPFDHDSIIRCLETPNGEPAGWYVYIADGRWAMKKASSVKMILQELGYSRTEAEKLMGWAEFHPWKLVMLPFQSEYPGDRRWNLGAPQLRYEGAPGRHPTWDRVLNHIGREMDTVLPTMPWAIEHGIRTGREYLQALFASIVRTPELPTPYLFLFGPENSGKSIIHEAFELLVTSGVVMADRALSNQSDFCGELDGAILCIVEEKNLSKVRGAHAKVKQFVTAKRLSIRKMRTESYMTDNLTHWLQCSNDSDACFVSHTDTRVQPLYVAPLEEEIPKETLLEMLKAEAPQFVNTLLTLKLPPATGRLALEIVNTESRRRLADESVNEFVVEVASFAQLGQWPQEIPIHAGDWNQGAWLGNAKELANAINDVQHYPGAPRDARVVLRLLDENQAYLRSRNVAHSVSEKRTEKGRLITLAILVPDES